MALKEITPLQITIQTMKDTIKVLQRQVADLEAQQPEEPTKRRKVAFKNPRTGKVKYF
jgi:CCR4-NOT transcriptional regulation complex NOT5 subunit